MKKPLKSGFTIIEVTLVLAISMLLLVGLLANITSTVSRQRYNDSIQSFAEYLRSAYSDVINVENFRRDGASNFRSCTLPGQAKKPSATVDTAYDPGYLGYPGRTECAIYGKLLTFGETDSNDKKYENESTIHEYDIIGDAVNSGSAALAAEDTLDALFKVNADAVALIYDESNPSDPFCHIAASGTTKTYTPTWGARVEDENGELFTGSVLIVRSPISGAIHTYILAPEAIKITDVLNGTAGQRVDCSNPIQYNDSVNTLVDYLTIREDEAEEETPEGEVPADDELSGPIVTARFLDGVDINFCIKSDDIFDLNSKRRNVRILADGRNVTAVQLVDADSEDNVCVD